MRRDSEEARKQRAFHRLGSDHPRCLLCPESDWHCLELHHIAGRAYDDDTAVLCRNCHRKVSNPSENGAQPADAPFLEQIGQWLVGLGEFFLKLSQQLIERGKQLLAGC